MFLRNDGTGRRAYGVVLGAMFHALAVCPLVKGLSGN